MGGRPFSSDRRDHAPDLRKRLASEHFDAREDIVVLHARPAHAHREVSNPGPMPQQQHVDHLCGGADGKTIGGEAAQTRLGRSVRVVLRASGKADLEQVAFRQGLSISTRHSKAACAGRPGVDPLAPIRPYREMERTAQ
jgi:hypothetical protein